MLYKGNPIEIIGIRKVFGKKVAWIRLLEDDTFLQVAYDELQNKENLYSLDFIKFVLLAAKIKDEIAKKKNHSNIYI